MKKLQGIMFISGKGTGYVKVPEYKEDIEIDFQDLNTALHGDIVEILLEPKSKNSFIYAKSHSTLRVSDSMSYGKAKQKAKVSKIIKRNKIRFVGVLNLESLNKFNPKNNLYFLKPDDIKMYANISISEKELNSAKTGQKILVEIISWKDARKNPEGKVIKVLGNPGDNNTEMYAIAIEKGFDNEFPKKVKEEAKNIFIQNKNTDNVKKRDYLGRRDFRKIMTFTIDPEDGKDFDDAISFKELKDPKSGETVEYEIGIHIADVSHYVRPKSALDDEARKRGTSVYLVDRTIPMLPEELSNDLCSLIPNEDRLTMSAVFILDKNAKIKKEWYGKTIIHSKKRLTYGEAENLIKTAPSITHKKNNDFNHQLQKALHVLNNLAKKLTLDRFAQGAISLDQEEVKFVLDSKGTPIKTMIKERGDSNRLIEEFMLLANKKVAEILSPKISKKNINKEIKKFDDVSIYRIHDIPSKEKMADLAFFLKNLGYNINLQNGIIPSHEINNLLKNLKGRDEEDTVQRAVVKSMAKAIYSTKNIGHYGLAFPFYTHFTSPIRRYPDIVVHRLLNKYLENKKTGKSSFKDAFSKEKLFEYENIAKISSEQEKQASLAERASVKYKQVEYMSKYIGESFEGVISGITEWGIYVEEIKTKCEGLVKLKDMKDDFYIFNEKKLELLGEKNKNKYRLGNRVKIKVKGVDLERKTIDYVLI